MNDEFAGLIQTPETQTSALYLTETLVDISERPNFPGPVERRRISASPCRRSRNEIWATVRDIFPGGTTRRYLCHRIR